MKKFLLALALVTAAFSASAEDNRNFIKLEGVHYNYLSAPNDKDGFNLTIGREVAPGVKVDLKQEFRDESNSQKISNRLEAGATLEEKIPFVKVGVRGAIGEKYTSGDNLGYWLVEPYVAYDINNDWSVKGSWRYRNAFDTDKNEQTNTYKIGAAYKVTTNWLVDGSLGKTTGDSEYTQVQAGVTYKF